MHGKTHRATQVLAFAALSVLSALVPLADEATPVAVNAGPRMSLARQAQRTIASKCVEPGGRTSYVDPDAPCAREAARYDVFAVADLTLGAPPEARMQPLRGVGTADEPSGRQCLALEELVRTIDAEVRRASLAARRDQLLEIRQMALAEQQRLSC